MSEVDIKPRIFQVGFHKDSRGTLEFVNQFDMKNVRRFYIISNSNTEIQRGWQGHKIEEKYFFAIEGSFSIALVKPDNWATPSANLELDIYELNRSQRKILHVPSGYATSIIAVEMNSQLLVFSTLPFEESENDDFRFSADFWSHSK
jgi:dTDP-4-dehydrorhamnose 3,5-epimerase